MYVFFMLIFSCAAVFAQTTAEGAAAQLAPGAQAGASALLNKPAMVRPPESKHLEGGWFSLETDSHVFTDEVSLAQVARVLTDLNGMSKIYDGEKQKLSAKVISSDSDGSVLDYTAVSIGMLGIHLNTKYRALVRTETNTPSKINIEVRQLDADSASNNEIKNLYALRYAEAVTIGGKIYTYIRIYTFDKVNASILPDAKDVLTQSSVPINIETLELIISAAKQR